MSRRAEEIIRETPHASDCVAHGEAVVALARRCEDLEVVLARYVKAVDVLLELGQPKMCLNMGHRYGRPAAVADGGHPEANSVISSCAYYRQIRNIPVHAKIITAFNEKHPKE